MTAALLNCDDNEFMFTDFRFDLFSFSSVCLGDVFFVWLSLSSRRASIISRYWFRLKLMGFVLWVDKNRMQRYLMSWFSWSLKKLKRVFLNG